jgi:uncharacterized delta-60 repeat protein
MKTRSPFFKKSRLAGLAVAIVAALAISMVALAAAGGLDPTFGNGGKVTTYVGSSNSFANAMAVQPDGKIVVAGGSQVVRYNSDGTLDTTFGTNGIVTNSGIDRGMDVAIQTDGKILVAGLRNFAIARFNSNGSIDTSFGTNGIVTRTFPMSDREAFGKSIAIQSDGRILAGGTITYGTKDNFALARYNANGTPDPTLGGTSSGELAGMVNTDFDTGPGGSDNHVVSMAIQADGKIILAGNSLDYTNPTSTKLVFARYNIDGSLDPKFGTGGKVFSNFGNVTIYGYAEALQSDGKIVAVGDNAGGNNNGDEFSLVRYNSDGSVDTTFGVNGLFAISLGSTANYAHDVAIQTDGKIVVAGDSYNGSNYHFAVARYNSNGSLDTTFGNLGVAITSFGNFDDHGNAIALQRDGNIVVAGSSSNNSSTGIAVARYLAFPTVTPPAFISQAGNDGWILESTPTSNLGGTQNGNATTFNVGDDQQNKQYRSILSFNTASLSSLPSNAIITSVTLKIRIKGVVGTDPFTTFGPLLVDMRSGYFGNSIGLELADFSFPASTGTVTERITPITYNWYGVNLSSTNFKFINRYGVTQFRLRFNLTSDYDKVADYDMFYSGNATSGYQPQLIVSYYVPTTPSTLAFVNWKYGFQFTYPSQGTLSGQSDTTGHIILPIVVPGTNLLEKYEDVSVVPNTNTCTSPYTMGYSVPYPSTPKVFNGLTFAYQYGLMGGMSQFHNWYAYSILKGNTCISLGFVLHGIVPGVMTPPPPTYDFNTEYAVVLKIMSSFAYLSP